MVSLDPAVASNRNRTGCEQSLAATGRQSQANIRCQRHGFERPIGTGITSQPGLLSWLVDDGLIGSLRAADTSLLEEVRQGRERFFLIALQFHGVVLISAP